jgi:hypothetical protein
MKFKIKWALALKPVARRSGWKDSDTQDENPGVAVAHNCRGVIVAQEGAGLWLSRRDNQALAVIVACIGGRPRPRLRSSAARRRKLSTFISKMVA